MSTPNDKKSVLFVCLGNVCRSPTGEGVLKQMLHKRGLSSAIKVDSAGTGGYNVGTRPDRRMRHHSAFRGYDLQSRARKITRRDLMQFDLVVAMDSENMRDIQRLHTDPTAELRMLSDFLSDEWPRDVPDPFFGGEQGFEDVLDMIEAACPAIIDHLTRTDTNGET